MCSKLPRHSYKWRKIWPNDDENLIGLANHNGNCTQSICWPNQWLRSETGRRYTCFPPVPSHFHYNDIFCRGLSLKRILQSWPLLKRILCRKFAQPTRSMYLMSRYCIICNDDVLTLKKLRRLYSGSFLTDFCFCLDVNKSPIKDCRILSETICITVIFIENVLESMWFGQC